MTKKQEREIRKKRREIKRFERERKKALRAERRRKRELAKQFVENARKLTMTLPPAPECPVCGERFWCIHNFNSLK